MLKKAQRLYLNSQFKELSVLPNDSRVVGYKIGALFFLGEHEKLRTLYKAHVHKMDLEQKILAHFHMGLSFTSTSEYKASQKFFKSNLILSKTHQLTNFNTYFVFQGLSFFAYFFSKHKKSQALARKAYFYLLKEPQEAAFLEILNLEIRGYNAFHLGKINAGFKHLEKALQVSKIHPHLKAFGQPIEFALLKFKCEHSVAFIKNISLLLKAQNSPHIDSVSRIGLCLATAKIYFFLGQYKKAHNYLTQNFHFIYSSQNLRLIAESNLFLARLLLHKGQSHEALAFINTIRSNLNPFVDKKLILSLLQLEFKILKTLELPSQHISEQIISLRTNIDSYQNTRSHLRDLGQRGNFIHGQDSLGDLLDEIQFHCGPQTLEKILDLKAYHLLFKALKLSEQKNYILIHHTQLLLISSDEIYHSTTRLSKTLIRMLHELTSPCNKQHLIEKVWGYHYDSLRHDSLVYTALTRLRVALEPMSHWIINDDTHYQLLPDVEIQFIQSPSKALSSDASTLSHTSTSLETSSHASSLPPSLRSLSSSSDPTLPLLEMDLNLRQIQFLNLKSSLTVNVEAYAKHWKVTKMTALRDLKKLCDLGYLKRLGKGRATEYYRL